MEPNVSDKIPLKLHDGRWSRFVKWGTSPPTRIGTIAGFLVIGCAMLLAFALLRVSFQHDRLGDLRSARDREYVTQVGLYSNNLIVYRLCLDNVRRYDLNHGQWQEIQDAFEQAAENGSAGAKLIYDLVRNGPLMTAPAITADQCTDPGMPPTQPNP